MAGAPGSTLLAFLSSGCLGCGAFWEALGARPRSPAARAWSIVTKDTELESPSKLLELAPDGVPLVMSTEAWDRYEVAGSPYFVLVDGPSGRVAGEGTATSWAQVASLLRDALADAELRAGGARASPRTRPRGWPGRMASWRRPASGRGIRACTRRARRTMDAADGLVALGVVLAAVAGLRSAWSP